MAPTRSIAVLVGSLRKDSINRRAAHALARLAPAGLSLRIVEIGDLPLYNPDLDEGSPPAPWQRLRDELGAADGVIFITPEYNRSLPAALKNAIDVGSRPYGASAFDGKPAAVMSISPGALGGFGANHHLRQSLTFLNMPVLQQPEAYLGGVGDQFGEDGSVANESTEAFLAKFITAYAALVDQVLGERSGATALAA